MGWIEEIKKFGLQISISQYRNEAFTPQDENSMKDTFEVGHLNFGAKTQNFELVE